MTDSTSVIGGLSNSGMSGGPIGNFSPSNSSKRNAGSVNSPATGSDLASTPTTSEEISRSPTTAEQLSSSPTTGERLTNTESAIDMALDSSKDPDIDMSLYSNQDESVNLGHVKGEYSAPDVDHEGSKVHASGALSGEITIGDAKTDIGKGSNLGQVEGKVTVGTINAHAKFAATTEIRGVAETNKGINAKLFTGAGAEIMAIDIHVGYEASITPKSIGDALSGVYNSYLDPVVDYVAGQDIPEIPEVPDYLDHGVVISGGVDGGIGASLKGSVGAEIGNGKGAEISGAFKMGLGLVVGAGVKLGVK